MRGGRRPLRQATAPGLGVQPAASREQAPLALADLLLDVSALLASVLSGQSASVLMASLPAPRKPAVQALLFAVLRRWGLARAVLSLLAPRRPAPAVRHLLGSALALLGDGRAPGMYADFTLVNEAVRASGMRRESAHQAGFINACLRRYLRERLVLVAQAEESDPAARWNLPEWWLLRLQRDFPSQWQAIAASGREMPPLTLRVNQRRSTVGDWQAHARREGVMTRAVGDADAVVLAQARPVQDIPGFSQGVVSVQDLAAQMAAPLLLNGLMPSRAEGALRVLDACAAPGGKSAHLLEHAVLDLTALDIDPARCERIRDNLARLGLSAAIRCGDAARPQDWWDGEAFDAIMLDAPCTASGIVRRHPDIPWLRRPEDVHQLALRQRVLLDALWPLLRPGGRLLYCTCSVFKSEGGEQAASFLARNTDARKLAAPGHLLPGPAPAPGPLQDNPVCAHDGFFYALFERAATAPG